MNKNLSIIEGEIISVSAPLHIERREKPSFVKVTMGLRTSDGQIIFFEVRESVISFEQLLSGGTASVEYYFAGSIKGDKKYNNIIAKHITLY